MCGKYKVIHTDINTGIVLMADGKFKAEGIDASVTFDRMSDAEKYANEKVKEIPNMECFIEDGNGGVTTINNSKKIRDKNQARKAWIGNYFLLV